MLHSQHSQACACVESQLSILKHVCAWSLNSCFTASILKHVRAWNSVIPSNLEEIQGRGGNKHVALAPQEIQGRGGNKHVALAPQEIQGRGGNKHVALEALASLFHGASPIPIKLALAF